MGFCESCNGRTQREHGFAKETRHFADVLIPILRDVAQTYGYALTTHGSMNWDIDIVLVPWRDDPMPASSVIERFKTIVEAVTGFQEELRLPTKKPCGRLAWVIHLTYNFGNGPYLDISVMPASKKEANTSDYPWLAGEAK